MRSYKVVLVFDRKKKYLRLYHRKMNGPVPVVPVLLKKSIAEMRVWVWLAIV